MYVRVSMVGVTVRTRGAPSKPTADRWARSAWVAGQHGAVGRRTVSPTRTTRPRLAVAPGSVCGRSAPLGGLRGLKGYGGLGRPPVRGVTGGSSPGGQQSSGEA